MQSYKDNLKRIYSYIKSMQERTRDLKPSLIKRATQYSELTHILDRIEKRGQIASLMSLLSEIKQAEEPDANKKSPLSVQFSENLKLIVQMLSISSGLLKQ